MDRAHSEAMDIIIPTYRPGEKFIRLLEMLGRQTLRYHRLIVINTEESLFPEAAAQKLSGMPDVTLLHIAKSEFDHGGTRRLGVSLSDAPYFLCMTDDAIPADTRLISELMHALLEGEGCTAMVYARQIAQKQSSESEKFIRGFNYPPESLQKSAADLERLGIKTFFASNVCCAYSRAVYDRLGGFVSEAIFNEDMIYAAAAIRAGCRIFYNADAKVIHSHDYSALQQLKRNFDLGASQAMHPEVFAGLKSEGEGIRLVKACMQHLHKTGHAAEIPGLVFSSGARYLGFRLGKSYRHLPKKMIRTLSMNPAYFEKRWN